MKVEWTKTIKDPEKKKSFEAMLRNNNLLLSRLQEILTEWETDILRSETKPDYTSPAWSHLQAHRNGNREIIKRVKDLLTLTKDSS